MRGLFGGIRKVMREERDPALKQARLFAPVLYADRLVTVTQCDVDRAILEVKDDELLHDLLRPSVDPDNAEIPGQAIDKLEDGEL